MKIQNTPDQPRADHVIGYLSVPNQTSLIKKNKSTQAPVNYKTLLSVQNNLGMQALLRLLIYFMIHIPNFL